MRKRLRFSAGMNKTENPAHVGKHRFTLAGLGEAPFRFVGMSENVITYPDGTSKAGGCCDYCFTGIRYECQVQSADGKRFKVGCDCIAKVGDEGLLKAYKTSPEVRAHKRALAAAKDAKVVAEIQEIIAANSAAWSAMPHSRGFIDRKTGVALTRLDELNWHISACGAAGRARNLKWLRRLAASVVHVVRRFWIIAPSNHGSPRPALRLV